MLFMSVATWTPDKVPEILKRRAEKGPLVPEGMEVKGEWAAGPYVIRIFETDDPIAILLSELAWNDLFDIRVYPVTTTEEVMEAAGQ